MYIKIICVYTHILFIFIFLHSHFNLFQVEYNGFLFFDQAETMVTKCQPRQPTFFPSMLSVLQCPPSTTQKYLGWAHSVDSPYKAAICGIRRWGSAVGGGWHRQWGREGLGRAESIHVSSHWHVGAHHRNWTEARGTERVMAFIAYQHPSGLSCWLYYY